MSGGFGTCKYCGCCTDGGRDVCSDCYGNVYPGGHMSHTTLVTTADIDVQLPKAVIKDAAGIVWEKHQRMYGSSWYRPGDRQPHGIRDIVRPATLLQIGLRCCRDATDHDAHVAERVAAELPRFGEIREAYEFYQLDSDKAMAAQIFAQQVGEILEAES